MAFGATLAYILLAVVAPWSAYPELAAMRIMLILMAAVLLMTVMQVATGTASVSVPQVPLIFVFVILTGVSVAATGWLGGALEAVTDMMVPLAAYIALVANVNSVSRLRLLFRGLVLVGTYLAIRGILAVKWGIGVESYALMESLGGNGPDDPLGTVIRARALGFLADPNDLAQYLLACMPLAAAAWQRGRSAANTVQVLLPVGVLATGVYFTRSRGGLVGFALLVAVWLSRYSRLFAPLAAAATVVGVLALGFSDGRAVAIGDGTGGGRIELWANALAAFRQSPVFGVGYGHIRDYLGQFTAHNSYVLCLVETGLPGLFFWLAIITVTGLQLRSAILDSQLPSEDRRLCYISAASIASVLVTSFFLSRVYALTLYIFLGSATATFQVVRRLGQANAVPSFRATWLVWNGIVSVAVIAMVYFLVRVQGAMAS